MCLSLWKPLAFFGDHVDQQRSVVVLCQIEDALHLADVVSVERSPVADVHGFKNVCGQQQRFKLRLDVAKRLFQLLAAVLSGAALLLDEVLELAVDWVDGKPRQMVCHPPDTRADGHFVVVEYDDNLGFDAVNAVESFKSDSVQQRSVSYHGDDVVLFTFEVSGLRVSHRSRYGCAAVSGCKKVVFAFIHARKACDAALFPQRVENIHAAGEYFVCISLVADVKNNFVCIRVKRAQQGHGKFYRTQ